MEEIIVIIYLKKKVIIKKIIHGLNVINFVVDVQKKEILQIIIVINVEREI